MVYIFYIRNVVAGVVNCKSLIYGGRTSLFLSSQRMPAVTSGDCEMIQLYEYIIVYIFLSCILCFHVFFLPRNFSFIKSVIFYSFFPLTRICFLCYYIQVDTKVSILQVFKNFFNFFKFLLVIRFSLCYNI